MNIRLARCFPFRPKIHLWQALSYGSSHPSTHHVSDLHLKNPDKYDEHGNEYSERPDPFGLPKGKRRPKDKALNEFILFYIGGTLLFMTLYHYKPDDSMNTWAKREALKRMRDRGIDVSAIKMPDFA